MPRRCRHGAVLPIIGSLLGVLLLYHALYADENFLQAISGKLVPR